MARVPTQTFDRVRTFRHTLILLLLLAGVFSIATLLQARAGRWTNRSQSDSILKVLLGDSRRLFANHFFVKADISYHSGCYPSIFDQARQAEEQENAVAHGGDHGESEHEEKGGFLGEPTDWIDRFGRHFKITQHTHLEGGNISEILPWLRISADLDPQRIETYTVAAFWLSSRLGKVDEAERFLREGLRANPNNAEILFELGKLQYENRHNVDRARNIWLAALHWWQEQEPATKKSDKFVFEEITANLARLEEREGNGMRAIQYFELAKQVSPNPASLQKQIDEIRAKLSTGRPVAPSAR